MKVKRINRLSFEGSSPRVSVCLALVGGIFRANVRPDGVLIVSRFCPMEFSCAHEHHESYRIGKLQRNFPAPPLFLEGFVQYGVLLLFCYSSGNYFCPFSDRIAEYSRQSL